MDLSKKNLEKCKSISEEGRKRIVKTIFINDSISLFDKDNIKNNVDIVENGFNIEKLFHLDDEGERIYFNLLKKKFENIFDKKEIPSDNKFIQAKTDLSFFEKLNRKYVKLGNRDLIKNGHTILIRTLTGQDKYRLDDNIDFINDVLLSVSYVKNNYLILKLPTTFSGNLRDACLVEYENARLLNKSLIIIYGKKLDTGVDIPEVNPDIIFNFSKLGSTDVAVQVLGRIQRANIKENKKFCFFFDFIITNILSSIYSNKTLCKTKTEYEFLYEYKDSIFNLNDTELVESDDNYIKELSQKVNDTLNEESNNTNFFEKASNGLEFPDIYQNSSKDFSMSSDKNSDIGGKSKSISKRDKKSDGSDESNNNISDETKIEIRKKLKMHFVLQEIYKIYKDMSENSCQTTEDIVSLILSNEDYTFQFKHNLGKMISVLKIEANDDIDDIIDYIINNIDFKSLNNNLLYFNLIQPINRDKDNINTFFE